MEKERIQNACSRDFPFSFPTIRDPRTYPLDEDLIVTNLHDFISMQNTEYRMIQQQRVRECKIRLIII